MALWHVFFPVRVYYQIVEVFVLVFVVICVDFYVVPVVPAYCVSIPINFENMKLLHHDERKIVICSFISDVFQVVVDTSKGGVPWDVSLSGIVPLEGDEVLNRTIKRVKFHDNWHRVSH